MKVEDLYSARTHVNLVLAYTSMSMRKERSGAPTYFEYSHDLGRLMSNCRI